MMETRELRELFPRTIEVLPSHRSLAEDLGGQHWLGEALLFSFVPEEVHEEIFWGLSIGTIKGLKIKTEHFVEGKACPLYLDRNFTGNIVTFELRDGNV